jgi:hypothetical protein
MSALTISAANWSLSAPNPAATSATTRLHHFLFDSIYFTLNVAAADQAQRTSLIPTRRDAGSVRRSAVGDGRNTCI